MKKIDRCMARMALLLAYAGLVARSGSPGSSAMANAIGRGMNEQFGMELVEIDNLKKIDAYQGGDGSYKAKVSFDIRFLQGHEAIDKQMQLAEQNRLSVNAAMGLGAAMRFGDFKKGDIRHLEPTEVTFRKSEQGWQVTHGL